MKDADGDRKRGVQEAEAPCRGHGGVPRNFPLIKPGELSPQNNEEVKRCEVGGS